MGILIGSTAAVPSLLFCILNRGITIRKHVQALHLLFVDDCLPGGDAKSGVAYSVVVKSHVHTVYNNGVYDADCSNPGC